MVTGNFIIFEPKIIRLLRPASIGVQFSSVGGSGGSGRIGSPGGTALSHTIGGFVCFLSGGSECCGVLEDSEGDERRERKDTITSSNPRQKKCAVLLDCAMRLWE
jgi:hypothetical protein